MVMSDGRIAEEGHPKVLLSDPASEFSHMVSSLDDDAAASLRRQVFSSEITFSPLSSTPPVGS